ncbi:Uridylate kinase [Candidatus Bilamarchaeum dharawalense]|uniref:UMP kinase n=1 Tax=Candidatus Bilamarchaeum dharawalense TaxID=2885759 RepID=A0A5E4LWV2_9ARCH|nr:Uridylate kinase [Candidatus Bilamarchaeum dharawalense]
MHIVLSLGGSLVNTENGTDRDYVLRIREIIAKNENKFGIVVGGGFGARKVAKKMREKGKSEFECDEAAIKITWKNAQVVADVFGDMAYPKAIKDFKKARKEACGETGKKVVVMGGTIPGVTTDTDSVLLAEALGSTRLINISNTAGIYDSNPKENPNAKKFDRMTYDQLIDLAVKSDRRTAGTNFVFDLLACKLIARSKIETHFVSGKNLEDVEKAVDGKPHSGTVVS